jgi:phosphoribosyl 1,2-cyclic phosphodiesterase
VKIRIWGCRGSLAAPGAQTVRYGGNTSSVEVRLDGGDLLVFDAGTGIRELGLNLAAEAGREPPASLDLGPFSPRVRGEGPVKVVHLFLTHLHIDHVEGLGFFSAIWNPDTEMHIWGPPSSLRSLEDRIGKLMSPPLFPVHLGDVPCRPIFHDASEQELQIGGARMLVQPVTHRGSTVGYRIEENGRSFAYIPDHEPALGVDLEKIEPEWVSGFQIAHGADVLFHDSQYTEEEYPTHRAWGHSAIDHTVTFGLMTKVRNLVLFHHDPNHSDEELEVHRVRAKELWGGHNDAPVLARDGMEIELPPER